MVSAEEIAREIGRLVQESAGNRHPDGQGPYFDAPLVGFASADDPLFEDYKRIIGPFHLTPREYLETAFGEGSYSGGSVICWILPITEETRLSNRIEERFPSASWARTRGIGEKFNGELRRLVAAFLTERGSRALVPILSPRFKALEDPRVGRASTWSERHAAFAAGLGTFSLNDGLITARGIAHRIGTVVTDLVLPATERPYQDHREYCLFAQGQRCAACAERCPVGAVSESGHDKVKCREHVYGAVVREVGERYGLTEAGCGLCQTGVPCESRIPKRKTNTES